MEQNWCWTCQKMCNFADRLTGNCMTDPYSMGCLQRTYTSNKTYPNSNPFYTMNTNSSSTLDDEYKKEDFDN